MAIIDLIAIAPFYMTFIVTDTRIIRILRFLRILRVTKHSKYSTTFHIITNTIYKKRAELFSSLILMFSLLLICSTGVYFAENEAQPEKFSSIPSSMWWAVATLTTVGVDDIFPITSLGKLLGSISAIFGIGFLLCLQVYWLQVFLTKWKKQKHIVHIAVRNCKLARL